MMVDVWPVRSATQVSDLPLARLSVTKVPRRSYTRKRRGSRPSGHFASELAVRPLFRDLRERRPLEPRGERGRPTQLADHHDGFGDAGLAGCTELAQQRFRASRLNLAGEPEVSSRVVHAGSSTSRRSLPFSVTRARQASAKSDFAFRFA